MTDTTARKPRRKERRAAAAAAAATILPPEGVPLILPIAGVGVRFAAQLADVLITGAFALSLVILLSVTNVIGPTTLIAVAALFFFAIRIPYYVLTELAWNGQTIGKRLMRIKVVAHTGGTLTTHAVVLRNLMKEAEVFLPGTLLLTLNSENALMSLFSLLWVLMALIIPLWNPHRMRLGDMLAGTHVVHMPVAILLADVARAAPAPTVDKAPKFAFLSHQLDHYGKFELQTLEGVLRAQSGAMSPQRAAQNTATLSSIVDRIRKKIGYADAVAPDDYAAFLQAFYNAQRAHLEQRQLFGDKRADKHHRASESG